MVILIDEALGKGAAEILRKVTVNIGVIDGGSTVNMVPGTCKLEADIRLPIGLDKESVMAEVQKNVAPTPKSAAKKLITPPRAGAIPMGKWSD